MLSINMDDVINVINSIKGYLIGFGIVAVLLIVAMIACRKMKKSKKYLIRFNAVLGIVLALGVTVNLILVGPCTPWSPLPPAAVRSVRKWRACHRTVRGHC